MKKLKSLKKKLQRKRQVYGCWATLASPLIPEIFSYSGFDFLVIDMEHSSIDLGDLLPMIISAEANQIVPLVRVGELNSNLIKRVMDAGAHGVIAANVSSREDAKLVVDAVLYPPRGKRGVGLYRASDYGENFEQYKSWLVGEAVVIVQIEHIDAVKNIESIFQTPGVDACLVGPYDLSASLGHPGNFELTSFKSAIKEILRAAKKYGIVPGFHSVSSDPDIARRRIREGYRMLAFSTDFMLLKDHAKLSLARLKSKL